MSKNTIIQHSDKIEITNKDGETIYFNNTDKYKVITVAKVASQSFLNILRFEELLIMENELSHSLLRLKNILQTTNNFIAVGIRNPIDRNLSYFYNISNIPDNSVSKLFQTKKDWINWLLLQRNDLIKPALKIEPIILEVLQLISSQNSVEQVSMSGSGATCFGVFESKYDCDAAMKKVQRERPEWWSVSTEIISI